MKKILVVAAHPDDEVLGCGGTIKKLIQEGAKVFVLILGEGITSRFDNREDGMKSKEIKEIKESIIKFSKILGIKNTFTYNFPDNSFDSVNLLDIVKIIEKIKNKIKPNIIYTHHRNDLNIDHRITYNAVLTSCRPTLEETVKEIYSFEVLSSTEWNYPVDFKPNIYVDISNTLANKIKAMKVYRSEIKKWPHPRSIKGIEVLAQKRGCEVGLESAEAFELVRSIR